LRGTTLLASGFSGGLSVCLKKRVTALITGVLPGPAYSNSFSLQLRGDLQSGESGAGFQLPRLSAANTRLSVPFTAFSKI